MAEPATLYKLMILYMLDNIEFPLSNTQLSNFFLEKDYTDYFTIQQVLHELMDSDLVRTESSYRNTHYTVTAAGKETLKFFGDKISPSAKTDILSYFQANKIALKNENACLADYYKTPDQDYAVHCRMKEGDRDRLDFTLRVQTKEQANAICVNWKNQADDVFACLMDILMK